MLITKLTSFSLGIFLIEQYNIVILLPVVVVVFAFLLLLGVRKSYKLKKENERLDKLSEEMAKQEEKKYEDFTEGHMYGNN